MLTAPGGVAITRLISSRDVRALYQPIVDLDSGQTVAFEALARGPEGSPLEFLTYDRELVLEAARALMVQIVPESAPA